MNAATRSELLRLALTLTPALAITAIGGIALLAGINGLGLVIGGVIATFLVGFGGLAVAASHRASLPVAASAALGSFVIRIGGAGVTAAGSQWRGAGKRRQKRRTIQRVRLRSKIQLIVP